MPRLNNDQRNQALGMLMVGQTFLDISRVFGCKKTIRRLAIRFRQTSSIDNRPRSSRPCVTTARQDQHLTLTQFLASHDDGKTLQNFRPVA